MSGEIRAYWDKRAKEEVGNQTATTNDVWLRELEIGTCVAQLKRLFPSGASTLLDAGCGDGHSTLAIARALPTLRVQGFDYAENMVAAAQASAAREGLSARASFTVGDVTALDVPTPPGGFDAAVTMRCLINLESTEQQAHAIGEVARRLRPGGYYLAIENFLEGQRELTAARAAVGLPEIPVRWHNRFFSESDWMAWSQPHFDEITLINFTSAYYFATRVVYSKMCQMRGEKPDYQHDIHKLAVDLPAIGNFSPIRLAVMRRRPA